MIWFFCLCLYCIWVSTEKPRPWFCLSICLGKQLSFIFMKLKLLWKPLQEEVYAVLSVGIRSLKKGWERVYLSLPVISCPTGNRHECTVKHRLYWRPFLSCSSLTILVVSRGGVFMVNRMGKQWNRPWACHFERHSRSRWCFCFWNLVEHIFSS